MKHTDCQTNDIWPNLIFWNKTIWQNDKSCHIWDMISLIELNDLNILTMQWQWHENYFMNRINVPYEWTVDVVLCINLKFMMIYFEKWSLFPISKYSIAFSTFLLYSLSWHESNCLHESHIVRYFHRYHIIFSSGITIFCIWNDALHSHCATRKCWTEQLVVCCLHSSNASVSSIILYLNWQTFPQPLMNCHRHTMATVVPCHM